MAPEKKFNDTKEKHTFMLRTTHHPFQFSGIDFQGLEYFTHKIYFSVVDTGSLTVNIGLPSYTTQDTILCYELRR